VLSSLLARTTRVCVYCSCLCLLQRRGARMFSRAVRVKRTRRVAGVMTAATRVLDLVSTAEETDRATSRLPSTHPWRVLQNDGTSLLVHVSVNYWFSTVAYWFNCPNTPRVNLYWIFHICNIVFSWKARYDLNSAKSAVKPQLTNQILVEHSFVWVLVAYFIFVCTSQGSGWEDRA